MVPGRSRMQTAFTYAVRQQALLVSNLASKTRILWNPIHLVQRRKTAGTQHSSPDTIKALSINVSQKLSLALLVSSCSVLAWAEAWNFEERASDDYIAVVGHRTVSHVANASPSRTNSLRLEREAASLISHPYLTNTWTLCFHHSFVTRVQKDIHAIALAWWAFDFRVIIDFFLVFYLARYNFLLLADVGMERDFCITYGKGGLDLKT